MTPYQHSSYMPAICTDKRVPFIEQPGRVSISSSHTSDFNVILVNLT